MLLIETDTLVLSLRILLLGAGATVFMDLIALVRGRFFGVPSLNYAMVGRWLGHLPRGSIIHRPITGATPIAGEVALGWAAHYLIGIGFAALFVTVVAPAWMARPTLLPALGFGALTTFARYVVLQPCLGAGFAARKTPDPWLARRRTMVAHLVFGLGLWVTGVAIAIAGQ